MVPVPVATYGDATLGAVLPGIAAALGATTGLPAVFVPPTDRVCLVLIDGLGDRLLAENRSSAPFLSGLRDSGRILQAGCPATTATSMGSLGTGRPPGEHGLVGYEVLDPARQVLLNELRWHPSVDPLHWQPVPTVFEHLLHAGIAVTTASDPAFAGSGLTIAALRGGAFSGSAHLPGRIADAVRALTRPGLAYLYWPDVDTAGHLHGCRSPQWRAALRYVDRQLARLAVALPAGTVLMVTADHGMVDVPHRTRLDLADRPDLAQGVRLLGGDPRLAQLYCAPGAEPSRLAARWSDALGDRAWVRTRDQAVQQGWFGPTVEPRVLPRLGDVLVAASGDFAVVDSRITHPSLLTLVGHHGSLTPGDQDIPLLMLQV